MALNDMSATNRAIIRTLKYLILFCFIVFCHLFSRQAVTALAMLILNNSLA
jgi:hypothetical protein